MKHTNIKSIIPLIFSLLWLVTSCTDLEEEPFSFVSPNDFYQNEDEAIAAVNAAYDALQDGDYYGGVNMRVVIEYPTEMATNHRWWGSRGNFDFFWWTPDAGEIEYIWQSAYVGVNRANAVIDRVPLIEDLDDQMKKRIEGEARFLRALNYFNLVRLFGDVPLITQERTSLDNIEVAKDPTIDVYNQIITDLEFAIANCPLKSEYEDLNKGRVSKGAAQALLGKVYLTMAGNPLNLTENYAKAEAELKKVIDSKEYDLFPEYFDVFDINNKNGIEHIFDVQFGTGFGGGNGNAHGDFYNPGGFNDNDNAWGGDTGEPEFIDQFDPSDKRIEQGMILQYEGWGNDNYYCPGWDCEDTSGYHIVSAWPAGDNVEVFEVPYIRKFGYMTSTAGWANYPYNLPIIRYADVLLMYAEAINEQGGPNDQAYWAINQVRQRAGVPEYSGMTQEDFREAMIQERKFELFHELHGWFDYVRKGVLEEIMESMNDSPHGYPTEIDVQPKHYIMPTPVRDLDLNKALEQHELWK